MVSSILKIKHFFLTDDTLTSTTTLDQNGAGNNGNEGVLHILQSFRTGASDGFMLYPEYLLGMSLLAHCRDAVSIFYSLSWLGYLKSK